MSTKKWILLFSVLAIVCIVLTLVFFCGGETNEQALVYSDGELVLSLDLHVDGTFRVDCPNGWNEILVEDGKVSVSAASCVSQDCVRHPPADHGAPIVCLPHRMVIRFSQAEDNMDALLS